MLREKINGWITSRHHDMSHSTLYCCIDTCIDPASHASLSRTRSAMRVVCVPVLSDNFAYLLIDDSGVTAAIDPAEPDKVRLSRNANEACYACCVLLVGHALGVCVVVRAGQTRACGKCSYLCTALFIRRNKITGPFCHKNISWSMVLHHDDISCVFSPPRHLSLLFGYSWPRYFVLITLCAPVIYHKFYLFYNIRSTLKLTVARYLFLAFSPIKLLN